MHPYSPGQERYEQSASATLGMEVGLGQSAGLVLRRCEHQALYLQFQNRYPMGALISELLQIQDGKFIVRVQAQVGGSTLSTGLSAAYTPEMAEDQARLRALEVLGVFPASGFSTQEVKAELLSPPRVFSHAPSAQFPAQQYAQGQLSAAPYPVEAMPSRSPQEVMVTDPSQRILESPAPSQSSFQSAFQPSVQPSVQPSFQPSVLDWTPEPEAVDAEPHKPQASPQLPIFTQSRNSESGLRPSPATPPKRSTRTGTESSAGKSTAAKATKPQPVDLSEVIAQTSVEVKRLKWTEAEGRQHLQTTYGKRSRQQLTDEELIDFLKFLEAQPTPIEALP